MLFKVAEFKLKDFFSRKGEMRSLPHYVRDYRKHVKSLMESATMADAMALAVGGEFESFGLALKDFVIQCGLMDGMTLVDIGCGSGRLAYALRDMNINYVGTDVVPELIDYARNVCERPDWRFEIVHDLKIPASDHSADMVIFVSVLTHLRHEESFIYLMEAARVLKSRGKVLFTFLDYSQPNQWIIFERFVDTIRNGKVPAHVDQFIDKAAIAVWAAQLGLEVKEIFDGSRHYIRLSQEITRDDGSKLSGDLTLGQSACVLQKL